MRLFEACLKGKKMKDGEYSKGRRKIGLLLLQDQKPEVFGVCKADHILQLTATTTYKSQKPGKNKKLPSLIKSG
jgi:hypothetical protein